MYTEQGESIYLPNSSSKIQEVLAELVPTLEKEGKAIFDTSEFCPTSSFNKMSVKTKLLRISNKMFGTWFGKSVPDTVLHDKPVKKHESVTPPEPVEPTKAEVDALLDKQFKEAAAGLKSALDVEESTHVVGVTSEGKVIPNMDKLLDSHITHSVRANNVKGIERIIERMAVLKDTRDHSVEDLITFLGKSDLPITDDGLIISYKVVDYLGSDKDTFVDCHTRRVQQSVGSIVHVDLDYVNKSRTDSCAQGLHVCSRDYLSLFRGQTVVITLVKPEDFIAVPFNESSKCRVMSYQIVKELSQENAELVMNGKTIPEKSEDGLFINNLIAGFIPEPTKDVYIRGHKGTNILYTDLTEPVVEDVPEGYYDQDTKEPAKEATKEETVVPEGVVEEKVVAEEVVVPEPEVAEKPVVTPVVLDVTPPEKKTDATAAKINVAKYSHAGKIGTLVSEGLTEETYQMCVSIRKTAKKSWKGLKLAPIYIAELEKFDKKHSK